MSSERRAPHGGGADETEEVARRLDLAYVPWLTALSDAERAAIHAWQREDRHYESLQAQYRFADAVTPDGLLHESNALRAAVERGRLPFDVVAWKGVRSAHKVFGVSLGEVKPGLVVPYRGFLAVGLDRSIATPEFTHPPGPPSAALLRMALPEGFPIAWIAGTGDPKLRRQFELLGPPHVLLRVLSVSYIEEDHGLPEIGMEVTIR